MIMKDSAGKNASAGLPGCILKSYPSDIKIWSIVWQRHVVGRCNLLQYLHECNAVHEMWLQWDFHVVQVVIIFIIIIIRT